MLKTPTLLEMSELLKIAIQLGMAGTALNMDGGEGTHRRQTEGKEHIMHIYTFSVKRRCIIYVSYF